MRYEALLTRAAQKDIAKVLLYLFRESADYAQRWSAGLNESLASLSEMPERCRVVDGAPGGKEIRQLLYGTYRILFRIEEKTVRIQNVRHIRRKPLSSRRKRPGPA